VTSYLPVTIYFALIVGFVIVSLGLAWFVRPSRPHKVKTQNYECGAEPIGTAWVQFPVGFYLVALVFIVLTHSRSSCFHGRSSFGNSARRGWRHGLVSGVLTLGWLYAYREGILEWK
jgi:NADH-quinone oxidoreductase subunit A